MMKKISALLKWLSLPLKVSSGGAENAVTKAARQFGHLKLNNYHCSFCCKFIVSTVKTLQNETNLVPGLRRGY